MSLLAIIFALLLEQLKPLSSRKYLNDWLCAYADFFQRNFNAGERKHGQIAWIVAVLLPLAVVTSLFWLLAEQHPVLAWAFCVLVLYLTMGFRQFSHNFTDIHKALRSNDLKLARNLLGAWRSESCDELSSEEVVRLSIEEALLATHRNVFAVVVWFVIFMFLGLGPSGAILYRLSRFLNMHWGQNEQADPGYFGRFAAQAYHYLEWLPTRLTAATFAIVGNFEDAIYCWRTQAQSWPDPEGGIVLASGAGALGVRLGMPVTQLDSTSERPELGTGDMADVDFMQSAVGLVWRALVFWLIMLLLLIIASMASWVGA
ncbi:MAG: threonine-phosphate decarboxylase [Gallionellales bacterium 35-53-114]|jgi:cobalamin biosynthesis protein CobD/CbiB|nr:MAG: threonine-phosphate decarboxylase [Gallionellales bacterium 35-53-114]OYZ65430.1 MAG: threonine-phosphate decarboxylase [Gallionellales bacterium 24-53-125]OZB08336.1 MAG: threonine-phosphate decarboxylase [Gallionellales bacterium 39-52-133]HQS58277.1 CobD/CbiB family protein [Gallionellaceae bacterium]HQS73832.1 CobD/CbiB family protein [Gallionellaceae bacterium]